MRTFLLEGDEEEQQAFEDWNPTPADLEAEWKGLMQRVPPEEAKEVEGDFKKSSAEDKKRMVWDVRKFLDEQDEEEDGAEEGGAPAPGGGARPPPQRPPTDAELEMGGRSEVRRRGGATRGREYERSFECGFDGDAGSREGREWDEYYSKEVRSRNSGTRKMALYGGACVLLAALALVLTATALADEDESVFGAAMRLIRLG